MSSGGDVGAFLRRCRDPLFFAEKMLDVVPHPGQAKFLTEADEYINLLTPGNRWGKSYLIALRHLWHAFSKIGVERGDAKAWQSAPYTTISVSHSADQAEIVFDYVHRLSQAPQFKPFVKRSYATPFPTLILVNGAEITCRSSHDGGKYIDGHRYAYVSIDEAGWIEDLRTLMNNVVIMRLAGGGMIDLIGTPKGIGSGLYWYWNRAERGVDGYYAQRGSIYDNPHLSLEDIKRRDELLSHSDPRLRQQVIYGDFVSSEGLAFTADEITQLFVPGLPAHQEPIEGLCWCDRPDDELREPATAHRHQYFCAWDLGRRHDATVGMTFDVTFVDRGGFATLVDYQRLLGTSWEAIYDTIGATARKYSVAWPRIDSTGPQGDVIEEELWKRGVQAEGFKMSSGNLKTNLINSLQSALSHGRKVVGERDWLDEAGNLHRVPDLEPPGGNWGLLRMPPIPQIVDEFGVYKLDDRKLTQDSVIAAAMVAEYLVDKPSAPEFGGLYGS